MSVRDLSTLFGLNSPAFRAGEQRAVVPAAIRDVVARGWPQVILTMTPDAALRLADDVELAISVRLDDGGGEA